MVASDQEPDGEQSGPVSERSNWLRAGVLGANDGLVSTAGLVVGVAGATSSASAMFTAGLAGLVAGSLSMAGGEYVSVSSQRDAEQAALEIEQEKLETRPRQELEELAKGYEERGIPPELALEVASELMKTDALRAHAEIELKIDPDELTKPWHAAAASFLAFAIGAAIPTLAILTPLDDLRVVVCVVAVLIGLTLTGLSSARLGNASIRPAIIRNVAVGALTMSLTWIVGRLTGGLVS
ncbi:MAG: VIT family protein [Thermomicrobiales bacterium]|nr:VIT family protein [Thermomicrobiales bacterium]